MPNLVGDDPRLQEALQRCFPDTRLHRPACGVHAAPIQPFRGMAQQRNVCCEVLVVTSPACYERAYFVYVLQQVFERNAPPEWKLNWLSRVFPRGGRFKKSFPNTDKKYLNHYYACCSTIEVSPEASAAMSRRCLEELLQDQGYVARNIGEKIKNLLDETDPKKHLQLDIYNCVDHIRTFGNFSTHPLTNQTSLQIVEVEPGEAEWCIDILEQLFDHYFERPAAVAQRIASANAKLQSVGKKPALP
jgi:hypothetical protein